MFRPGSKGILPWPPCLGLCLVPGASLLLLPPSLSLPVARAETSEVQLLAFIFPKNWAVTGVTSTPCERLCIFHLLMVLHKVLNLDCELCHRLCAGSSWDRCVRLLELKFRRHVKLILHLYRRSRGVYSHIMTCVRYLRRCERCR